MYHRTRGRAPLTVGTTEQPLVWKVRVKTGSTSVIVLETCREQGKAATLRISTKTGMSILLRPL